MASLDANRRWLYGPGPDLLLGCGLAYVVLFVCLAAIGSQLTLPAVLAPLLALGFGAPHYGATILRVYERRSERHRYAVFGTWITLLIVALFFAGLYHHGVAVALFTLYITWSPWHYSGQNYGIAVMFLRRRGVDVDPVTKRLLHLSFVTSFAITFLVLHAASGGVDYNPNALAYDSDRISIRPLGIPREVATPLTAAALSGYVLCTLAALARLRRRASARDLLPSALLVATQALWFAVPFSVSFLGLRTGIAPIDHLDRYVLWTAVAHAIQYLWITSYYARSEPGWSVQSTYLAKALAAGTALWTLPVILFAPDWSGGPEYLGGLSLLVAATVNLHHFVLDGAIWKLRNLRIASVLIREAPEPETSPSGPSARRPVWASCVWALCAVSVALALLGVWWTHRSLDAELSRGNLAGAEAVLDRLAWIGQDDSRARTRLALQWMRAGEMQRAEEQLERSLELRPSPETWTGLAVVAAQEQDWERVLRIHGEAGVEGPELGTLAARAHYAQDEPERARALLADLAGRELESARYVAQLAAVAREMGDVETAVHYYREALSRDPQRRSAANNLAWLLATSDLAEVRDPERAVHWASRAVDGQEPPDPNHLETLAVAHAAAGNPGEAREVAARAALLAHEQGKTELAGRIESRLGALDASGPAAP